MIQRYKNGFSLFEVLIALVILAIGMLGIARLLIVAHKSNSSSYLQQQAVQSAYDIIDRIRANRATALTGNYSVSNLVSSGTPSQPSTPGTNCETASCSSTQLASYDTWHWLSQDLTKLPNGCGSISTTGSGINTVVTVTVQWDDSPNLTGTPTKYIVQSEL